MKRNLRLQHSALVLALAAAYPIIGHGAAGTAQFTAGDVSVRRGNAAPAPLAKGATVDSGDAIITGARGVAQVKFTDGGYVAIQPNSQFDITRYANNNDGAQDSFLVNLARGGMRAITGLIGKRNTANYKVTTSTATVGIRGSSFQLNYNPDGSITVSTEQDAIEVCTQAGCTSLTAGESATVNNANNEPTRTNVRTSQPLAPYRQDPQVAGNQTNPDGSPSILGARQPDVPNLAFVWSGNTGEGFQSGTAQGGTLYFGANGAPSKYTSSYGEGTYQSESGFFAGSDAVTVFTTRGSRADEDLMVLGLWTTATAGYSWTDYGGQSGSGTYSTYNPLAFVAGQTTPEANIAAMNMTATYSLSAATPVLVNNGYGNGTLDSATLGVNFFGGTNQGTLDMHITVPHGGGDSAIYSMGGSVYGEGAYFQGYVSTGSSYGVAPLVVSTNGSANANVMGFFGGKNAQWAGLSYAGYANDGEGSYLYNFGGAAILGQTGATQWGPGQQVTGIGQSGGEGFYQYQSTMYPGTGSVIDTLYRSGEVGTAIGGAQELGSVQVDGSKVSLTYWANSLWQEPGYSSYNLQDYVFVAGPATSSDYISTLNRTATYSLTNGVSSPVYSENGGVLGTLDSATLGVNFAGSYNSSGTLDMSFTLGGSSSGVHTYSGSVNGYGNEFYSSSSVQGAGSAGMDVQGYFYGSDAQYAGLTYGTYERAGENFHGAAILAQADTPVLPAPGVYSNLASFAAWSSHRPADGEAATTNEHQFASGPYLSAINGSSGFRADTTVNGSFSSAGSAAAGDFVGWGKWESASVNYSGSSVSADNVHYVVGIPTTQDNFASLSGSASYSVTGATAPTAANGQTGELVAAQLQVNFGSSPTVSAAVTTKFGSDYVLGNANSLAITTTPTGNSFSGTQNGSFSGLFTGPAAERAGLVYNLNGGGTYGTVNGAVGFQKDSTQQPPLVQ